MGLAFAAFTVVKRVVTLIGRIDSSAVVYRGVACRTKRNQVLLGIIAGLAAEL
jgi:hypothetical protein